MIHVSRVERGPMQWQRGSGEDTMSNIHDIAVRLLGLPQLFDMIPLYDFNVMCCALATFSAAVGYRYSRRRAERRPNSNRLFDLEYTKRFLFRRDSRASVASADTSATFDSDVSETSSDYPTPSESLADVTEPGSLKRKTREDDTDHFADGDGDSAPSPPRRSCSPPRKRCRTPAADEPQADVCATVEMEEPGSARVEGARDSPPPETSTATELHEKRTQPPPASTIETSTSEPVISSSQRIAPASSSTLPSSFTIPMCKPSSAFSAFTGESAGFGSALVSTTNLQRPVWCSGTTPDCSGSIDSTDHANKVQIGQPEREDAASVAGVSAGSANGETLEALAAHVHAPSTYVGFTGEEDEEVSADLKGVKLFVKRGTKEFSTGMLGHAKLLTHKDTREERLVFRREPVWKVSMSVRLRPAARCSYDEEHGILRIAQKEPAVQGDTSTANATQEVVVYALTRGKSSKADFAQLARTIASSPRLGEQPTQVVLV